MSALGRKATCAPQNVISAPNSDRESGFSQKTPVKGQSNVRFGPIADISSFDNLISSFDNFVGALLKLQGYVET